MKRLLLIGCLLFSAGAMAQVVTTSEATEVYLSGDVQNGCRMMEQAANEPRQLDAQYNMFLLKGSCNIATDVAQQWLAIAARNGNIYAKQASQRPPEINDPKLSTAPQVAAALVASNNLFVWPADTLPPFSTLSLSEAQSILNSPNTDDAHYHYAKGNMYVMGYEDEFPQDFAKAAKEYGQSIVAGGSQAIATVGALFGYGYGVSKDLVLASTLCRTPKCNKEFDPLLSSSEKAIVVSYRAYLGRSEKLELPAAIKAIANQRGKLLDFGVETGPIR